MGRGFIQFSIAVSRSRAILGSRRVNCLGRDVRNEAAFQECNLIFQQELAPLQAPQSQFVQILVVRQSFYYFIQIAVFDP